MKRGGRKFLGLFGVLVIFSLVSLIFIQVVSAADTPATTTSNPVGIIKSLWNAFFGGLFEDSGFLEKVQLSKLLLMVLVALLVYSVMDFLPFASENELTKWGVSIIVAVLSFLFVQDTDIKLILTNYEALGVVLTSIIPAIIIFTFTFKIREDRPQLAFLNRFIEVGFILYLLIKWSSFENTQLKTIYLATAVITLVWLFFEKPAVKAFIKSQTRGGVDKLKKKLTQQRMKRNAEARDFELDTKF